jgi:hypothetical protein
MPKKTRPLESRAGGSYRSRPITRRKRRSAAEISGLKQAIYALLEEDHPQTVRQVFYRLTSAGQIEKSEDDYKNVVGRLLVKMRLAGEVPFDWIADNTRWMRKPKTFSSMEQALANTAQAYRRSLWDDQSLYVEVWTEKDALAGVLLEETARWDVPLMVSRGFASVSYLYEAAEVINQTRKPAFLYYFGDHDPSGIHIDRAIERRLREFASDAEIHFERVAVRPEQIAEWHLLTRPTKKSDSRSKGFSGGSVEVDAIPAVKLRELVSDCITRHMDQGVLRRTERIEQLERETLANLVRNPRLATVK